MVHVVKVIPADAPETVGDRFQADPFGCPISFGCVSRANDLREFDEGSIFIKPVARDYRVERAVFPVMPELGIEHVKQGPISDHGPVRVVRQKNEFGVGIDEFRDQPRTGNPIDPCLISRDPFHMEDLQR
jgi:hypothetical protein